MPGAELCHNQVLNEVNAKIKKTSREGDVWIMPDGHEGMLVLDEMSWTSSYKANYDILLHENTVVSQANIGGRIATIAAMVIPTVRGGRTTAFQVVDLEPMTHPYLG